MNRPCVRQVAANLAYADAVTNDVLEIDRRLRGWGCESEIYAASAEPRLGAVSRPASEYEPHLRQTDDILIFHYSIFSPTLDLYRRSRNRKLLIYHNITPPEFFHGFDPHLEALCRAGRAALPTLADCDFALADSEFNRGELVAAGVPAARTAVRPVAFDLANLAAAAPNPGVAARVRVNAGPNLLFVSRLAPNKRCEDLLTLLRLYREEVDPGVHLWLVGSRAFETYAAYLDRLADRLALRDAVTFTDRVSRPDLRAYYESCDLFVSASQHEGFGVPFVEAMQFGLPILARAAGATPETLGGAGILVSAWRLPEIAEIIRLVTRDRGLAERIVARQKTRLAELAGASGERVLRDALARLGAL
jgi:glycosyltransferase involved in cell wall biosynthesis